MRVLVTGGAGYIGSHTVNQLVSEGHEVTVLDNLSTGSEEAFSKDVKLNVVDIRDQEKTLQCLKEAKPRAIMHFAGKISVPESISHPLDYFETNSFGTLNILEAANQLDVEYFVFSSTAAVYGDVREPLVRESSLLAPINPYGHSKAFAEQIITANAAASGMKYGILRYFNVAGAARDGSNGQRGKDVHQLVHVASEAALGIRPYLSVFGNDYETADGTCVRDYIHVEDLASAHLATLRYLDSNGRSAIMNVGYGHGSSVMSVINTMKKVSGVDFPVRMADRRPGDPAQVIADNSQIRELTDWVPRSQSLDEICRSSLEWLRRNR